MSGLWQVFSPCASACRASRSTSLQFITSGLSLNRERTNFDSCSAREPERRTSYLFSAMVGMARCAVAARVIAGGTNIRAAMVFEGVAPLHAARTSQRDVPTTLTVLYRSKDGQMSRVFTNRSQLVGLRRSFVVQIPNLGSARRPSGRTSLFEEKTDRASIGPTRFVLAN